MTNGEAVYGGREVVRLAQGLPLADYPVGMAILRRHLIRAWERYCLVKQTALAKPAANFEPELLRLLHLMATQKEELEAIANATAARLDDCHQQDGLEARTALVAVLECWVRMCRLIQVDARSISAPYEPPGMYQDPVLEPTDNARGDFALMQWTVELMKIYSWHTHKLPSHPTRYRSRRMDPLNTGGPCFRFVRATMALALGDNMLSEGQLRGRMTRAVQEHFGAEDVLCFDGLMLTRRNTTGFAPHRRFYWDLQPHIDEICRWCGCSAEDENR